MAESLDFLIFRCKLTVYKNVNAPCKPDKKEFKIYCRSFWCLGNFVILVLFCQPICWHTANREYENTQSTKRTHSVIYSLKGVFAFSGNGENPCILVLRFQPRCNPYFPNLWELIFSHPSIQVFIMLLISLISPESVRLIVPAHWQLHI